jgi:hypothetical protein
MRNLSIYIILLFVLFQVSACKKENTNIVTETSTDYYPTTKGSYWIYETYYEDSKNNTTGIVGRDTVFAEGDTVVCGSKAVYLKAINNFFIQSVLAKDSSGKLIKACTSGKTDYYPILDIDKRGDTLFKGITDNNILDRTVFMRGADTTVIVSAGSFKCAVMQQNLKALKSGSIYEEAPPIFDCYSKGVGLVLRKIYTLGQPEKQYYVRLIEYNVVK